MSKKMFLFYATLVFTFIFGGTLMAVTNNVKIENQNTKNILVRMDIESMDKDNKITGSILIELYPQKAPISVINFLDYVKEGYYNGTIFHRVIDGFMIQGGGFLPGLIQKEAKAPIKNEADNGLPNKIGSIAMARTNVIDSATSQFFINVEDNTFLNHRDKSMGGYGYAVFGQVVKGMDLVNKIKAVKTGSVEYYQDVPVYDVIITSMNIVEK
jgi:peptidyl-prolyl cis-trans isomerase B (cyclophilin B)